MKFISPLKVLATKTRQYILNLNIFRNTHYRILNNWKINYKEIMKEQIDKSPKMKSMICAYKVFPKSKREYDIGNVCSVHEKFFEDAFVELGKLEDDNSNYVPIVVFLRGEVDKENPRVEIEVQEFNKKGVDKIVKMMYNIIGGK